MINMTKGTLIDQRRAIALQVAGLVVAAATAEGTLANYAAEETIAATKRFMKFLETGD